MGHPAFELASLNIEKEAFRRTLANLCFTGPKVLWWSEVLDACLDACRSGSGLTS